MVLVAGGTGGLARSPRALAATGLRFVLIGKTEAHARAAEEAFSRAGAEARGLAADVLRDGALGGAVEGARAFFGVAPAIVVWNVGFIPWPAPEGWEPSVFARVARDEARALGSLAQAILPHWQGGAGTILTIEGHSQERMAGPAPVLAVAASVRGAVIERLRGDVPGLVRTRLILGAVPSGPAGEGRWLSQDEIASAVADAILRRPERSVAGDLALAASLAERYRRP